MRAIIACIALCMSLCVCGYADDTDSAKPIMPKRLGTRVLIVGPKDSLSAARTVSGKARLMAAVPSSVKAAEVEFFMDGASVGKCNSKPFRMDIDTATIKAGEHIFKAVASDGGSETWSASSKARVEAADAVASDAVAGDPVPTPDELAPAVPDATPPPAVTPPTTEASPARPGAGGVSLGKAYMNRTYGFSVSYPTPWAMRDDTAAVAKARKCAFWVVLGTDPITINIHGQPLAPDTDADKFARHNPYVQTWVRKSIDGKTAFATTTGSASDKNVIHRLIIIDKGRVWMLNCTDKSGAQPSESETLFNSIIRTFQPLSKK